MEMPPQHLPSPSLRVLAAAIQRFCDAPDVGSPRQAATDLVALRSLIDRLEVSFSILAGTFADSDEYDLDGCSSPITWIRNHCKMGSGAAADRICLGSALDHLAEPVQAMDQGELALPRMRSKTSSGRT